MTEYKRPREYPNINREKIGGGYGPNITLPSADLSIEILIERIKKDASKFLNHIHYDSNSPEGELKDDFFEQGEIRELCSQDFVGISRVWKEKF